MFYIDPYYIILVLPTVIFTLIAQAMVNSAYRKYSQVPNTRGLTGKMVAEAILQSAGIYGVIVEPIEGNLTDHYDPKAQAVRLSQGVYNGTSVAAIGIAAHECGHAIQHHESYSPLMLRNAIIPATRIGSQLSWPLIIVGILLMNMTARYSGDTGIGWYIIMAGIALFGLSVVFQLITLPVEFNASRRAMGILRNGMFLTQDELTGARKVLTAAALTYVAALAQSLANMLRLLLLYGRRRRD